jgi:choline kinase
MKAILLAAGRGSRMKGLTEERPKCLVDVCGRPLIEWQLTAFRQAGIDEIAIVTGYRRDLLADRGLTEFHNPRWAETQMVSSLACAQAWLEAEPCIVSYSDILYDAEAVRSLARCRAALAVTYDPNWLEQWERRFGDPLVDAETFRLKPDHTLAEIGNKPASVQEVEGQYMGVLRFTPSGWSEVQRIRDALQPAVRDRMQMTGTLQKVIEEGRVPVEAVPYTGAWGEFDSEQDIRAFDTVARRAGFLKN